MTTNESYTQSGQHESTILVDFGVLKGQCSLCTDFSIPTQQGECDMTTNESYTQSGQHESTILVDFGVLKGQCSLCTDEKVDPLDNICVRSRPAIITEREIEQQLEFQKHLNLIEITYKVNDGKNGDADSLTVDKDENPVHKTRNSKAFKPQESEEIFFDYLCEKGEQDCVDTEISEIRKVDADWAYNIDLIRHQNRGICAPDDYERSNVSGENLKKSDTCLANTEGMYATTMPTDDIENEYLREIDDVNVLVPHGEVGSSVHVFRSYTDDSFVYENESKIKLKVVPRPPQDLKHQPNPFYKSINCILIGKGQHSDSFQNLKYKVKSDNGKNKQVDYTLKGKDFSVFHKLRQHTWLQVNELPPPKLDSFTVAYLHQFEPLRDIIDLIANGTPPTPHVSMRYELLRFCTLRSYPKENKPYLIKLAIAGFYYASDGDGVVCYCCGVRRYNWVAEDDPMKIHQRINPNCKFLRRNNEVNVPVKFYGPFSEKMMFIMSIPEPVEQNEVGEDVNNDWAPERVRSPAPIPQSRQNETNTNSLGINTGIPKHTQYATKTSREASFSGWPDSSSHTPHELAEVGFFYAGFGDCVRCFYCGIGLRHWTKDDNPWIEHSRWSRNCVYVKQKKGEEFVNLVQLAVQYSQDNQAVANANAGNQEPALEIERLLLSDSAKTVLEMGYQPNIIKIAIEQIRTCNGNTRLTAQLLMEKVLEIEDMEKETTPVQASAQSRVATGTNPAPQSAKPKTQKSGDGAQPTVDAKAEKKTETTSIAAADEAAKSDKETPDNDLKSQDPKTINAENEQLKEQTLCKVCLDSTVCIVFLPCGHLVTCADCAPAMRKCPICRALVKGTVRTYMS